MTPSRASAEFGGAPAAPAAVRARVRVSGVVQGVGFRPFVHRLAHQHALSGWVLNDGRGVVCEVQGAEPEVRGFLVELTDGAPPLARVTCVAADTVPLRDETGFSILDSVSASGAATEALVAPDAATCDDCVAELFDPRNRRFRHPFVNCTNCGPRFSIVLGIPYDRSRTTMAAFAMCGRCRAEYDDPADRRFHAQANACPDCGPRLALVDGATGALASRGSDALAAAVDALLDGAIVAVKGIGGYHLACRADSEAAVATLRARKRRDDKPFAVMAADRTAAAALIELDAAGEGLLCSPRRPIVIAALQPGAAVAPGVAPRSAELGVMLPYTPLHHLLLAGAAGPLVMTSGNVSDEPIAHRDEDALTRLPAIADRLLVHDRPIHVRGDDSVLRVVAARRRPLILRRSRGYVPEALALPVPAAVPVFACGGDLKSTFCVARGASAWVGPHVGDLGDLQTLRAYREAAEHFERLFAVTPAIVAHDMHPDYRSTAFAQQRSGVRTIAVQHHHAHLAACLAEHGESGPALGAVYDGTGYGPDGTVWGGELLVGGLRGFERVGHLSAVRMPGGERAIREPWRMACAWLATALGRRPEMPPALSGQVDERHWRIAAQMALGGFAAPVTTSAGRLFDAVAALCGVRSTVTHEGQAAAELETLCASSDGDGVPYPLECRADAAGLLVLDARDTVLALAGDLDHGTPPAVVAARFHVTVAEATATALARLAERHDIGTVALTGGVWQNRRLLLGAGQRLERLGLRVLVPERLPPNDGGLAFGQAAVAAARSAG